MSSKSNYEYGLASVSFIILVLSVVQYMDVPTLITKATIGDIELETEWDKNDLKHLDSQFEAAHVMSIITSVIAGLNFITEIIKLAGRNYRIEFSGVHYILLLIVSATTTGLIADQYHSGVEEGSFFGVDVSYGAAFIVSDVSVLVFSIVGLFLCVVMKEN